MKQVTNKIIKHKINYDCKANVVTYNHCPFLEKCLKGQINFESVIENT